MPVEQVYTKPTKAVRSGLYYLGNQNQTQLKPMSYTVYITETSYTSVSFGTKEEAEAFMKEPDYDLCDSWELSDSNIELVEEND